MDNLTHSLVGALIGQAGLKRKTGLAMPALIIGANLPDVDAACFFWLDGTEHLGFRRGITHGPPAMVLLPLVLAGLLYGFDRWQAKRGKRPDGRLPVSFKWLYLLSLIGCLSHPALDWMNTYGIRLLEPFSSRWFYGDILFIIDIWLWFGLGFATWLSQRREKRGGEWRKPARIAIAGALAYIGVNAGITSAYKAQISPHIGPMNELISSPVPVAFWQRENLVGTDKGSWHMVPTPGPFRKVTLEYLLAQAKELTPIHNLCLWQNFEDLRETNADLDAFLFWSRAPFAERASDGSVMIRDARFYDPLAQDRFTVALPDVPCVEPLLE